MTAEIARENASTVIDRRYNSYSRNRNNAAVPTAPITNSATSFSTKYGYAISASPSSIGFQMFLRFP